MKKALRILISSLIISALLVPAVFAESDYTHGFFKYRIEDGGVTITLYFGSEETVTVPNQIGGTPVSKISAGAFTNCPAVKSVILPDTIMAVEGGAFAGSISVDYSRVFGMNQLEAEPTEPDPSPNTEPEAAQNSSPSQTSSDLGSTTSEKTQEGVEAGATVNFETSADQKESDRTAREETTQPPEPASSEPTPVQADAVDSAPSATPAPAPAEQSEPASYAGPLIALAVVFCGVAAYAALRRKKKDNAAE